MATPAGGKPIDKGIVDRVAGVVVGGVVGAIQGASTAWFGPGQPLTPSAPPEAKGRAFDYPTNVNITPRPRTEQGQSGVSFETLRAVADPAQGGFDLLRLAIETVKDKMAGQKWTIRPRLDDEPTGKKRKGTKPDEKKLARAAEIKRQLRKPDGVHTFRQWQRMLLEDGLVIDAPAVYLAPSAKAQRIPQVMDGALLKRLVDDKGATPLPPEPAFHQVLKGVVAARFSLDEIAYGVRNLRSHRLYGMSPVEQVLVTVDIALRRQVSQHEFYSVGSIPDMLLGVPEEWTATQIKEWQAYFDDLLSGNTAERRRARFIPGGIKPFPVKEGQLKDQWDEWLARIICWCFSLSPQALVAQMNRATAETAKEQAQEDGLEPLKLWWADYMGEVLARAFPDGADYELAYEDEEIADAKTKAEVHSILVNAGIETTDEAREAYGLEVQSDEESAEGAPAAGGAEAVQDTALNGAQVTSLLDIVKSVTAEEIPLETARGMISAAFPMLNEQQVGDIVGGLEKFVAKKPEPPPQLTPPPPPKGGKQLTLPIDGAEPELDDEAKAAKVAKAAGVRKARGSLRQGEADQARPPSHAQGCEGHPQRYP
jgi:hypothetical protein